MGGLFDGMMADTRELVKSALKQDILSHFTMSGVVVILATINHTLIEQIMLESFTSVKDKSATKLEDLLDTAELDALFNEVRADIMATVSKINSAMPEKSEG